MKFKIQIVRNFNFINYYYYREKRRGVYLATNSYCNFLAFNFKKIFLKKRNYELC
jgi:hypothetical protein